MLCSRCSAIFTRYRVGGQSSGPFNCDSLQLSAQDGCKLCVLVLHHHNRFKDTSYGRTQKSVMISYHAHNRNIWFSASGFPLVRVEMFAWQNAVQFYPHTNLPRGTGSKSCKALVKQWVEHCLNNHTHCRRFDGAEWLPTRLVDVRTLPPRLVKGSAISPQATYATLSHRWKGDLAKLTEETFEAFENAIPVQKLSRTFLDAFEMARILEIQYVWIDCLCIIQDSKEDWEKEGATMDRVYKHGLCNFAATAAADGPDGLFIDRKTTWRTPFQVETTWTASRTNYVCVEEGHPSYDIEQTLSRRGWVFQEQVLSPRTIYFGKQLHWECEAVACEMFPKIGDFRHRCFWGHQYKGCIGGTAGLPTWLELVEKYSTCRLTFEKDKLIAFSGIAKEFRPQGDYLAGLWSDDLTWQLLWRPLIRMNRQVSYRAPSWSWASVDMNLSYPPFPTHARQNVIKVIAAETTPVHEPFGQVVDGYIKLQGLLHEGILCQTTIGTVEFRSSSQVFRETLCHNSTFCLDYRDRTLKTCYILPIALADIENKANKDRYFTILGLILKSAESAQYFNRCGFFEIRFPDNDGSKWPTLLQDWRSYLPGAPPPLESHKSLGLEKTDPDTEFILIIK